MSASVKIKICMTKQKMSTRAENSRAGSDIRGDVKIPHSRMTKTCSETLVTIFELLCTGTGPSEFCETSAKITNWLTDPLRWFCNIL